jgi:hypothetical protein
MTGGELGRVYNPGASIRGWRQYFPNATIYCCDIDRDIINFSEIIKKLFTSFLS